MNMHQFIVAMSMSSQLFSNIKRVLPCNCLATNNNFWCRQKLKIWISGVLFEQKRRSFNNLTHAVLWIKGELFYKNPFKEVSPQILISESTKSVREKLILSRFTHKKPSNSQRNKEYIKYALHRLLGRIITGTRFSYKQPSCSGSNVKNGLNVKQVPKQPTTLKTLM